MAVHRYPRNFAAHESRTSQQPASPTAPAPGADAKSYVDFGISNGAKGELDAAIEAFNNAIKIDPKYAPAYYNRALPTHSKKNQDEAISNYDQAIQLDSKYKEAYYQRGSLNGQKGISMRPQRFP